MVWLSDDSSSGKSLKRPAIQKALAMLAAHDADAIVTAKLDRLTRSVKDFMVLLEMSARQKWDIVVLDFQLDTTTASGRMSAGMMMQFAQFERELIGERTKAALAAAKSRGVVLGAHLRASTPRYRRSSLSCATPGWALAALPRGSMRTACPRCAVADGSRQRWRGCSFVSTPRKGSRRTWASGSTRRLSSGTRQGG